MVTKGSVAETFAAARGADRSSLARLLSLVERGGAPAREVAAAAFPLSGDGYTIGLTGAPGAGKSTLTSAVLAHVRGLPAHERVAVLAIDPSSPFTGGAILGDRVRMQDHATDDGVFIRSMATRGHLGGLSLAAPEAVRVLHACGWPWVLIETVGVGQVEVEIAGRADTTVVVVNPGWGDVVQANKAGLMEIADVFVINKADRPGAEQTRIDLSQMLEMADRGASSWRPPIVATVATDRSGAGDVWDAVISHRSHLESTGELVARRRSRLSDELAAILAAQLHDRARRLAGSRWADVEAAVEAGTLDPWTAAQSLLPPDDLQPPPDLDV